MQHLPDALIPFAAYRQFIVYRLTWNAAKGKWDKQPANHSTGSICNAQDPTVWTDHVTAIAAAARLGSSYGVGFVFTDADPFWFLDLDHCRLPDGAGWSPLAKGLINAFPGAVVEVSVSGEGLHIYGSGTVPVHGCKNVPLGIEFYTRGRFAALTGNCNAGNALGDFSYCLPWLVTHYFPPGASDGSTGSPDDWTNEPCEDWNGPTDDDELLRRATLSQSAAAAFGNKATFADLFDCNVEALARAYPADSTASSTPYDASSADRALAQHLAFWTGKDCDRILRLMRRSSLVRDKWSRDDYLPRTIIGAIADQRDVLTDKEPEPVAYMPETVAPAPGVKGEMAQAVAVTGATYLTLEAQVDMFRGCVYVLEQNRILVPGGMLLKPDQFRVMYGGYSFPMDNENGRTIRDSYEAFTQHQAVRYPRADSTCFKPDHAYGELVKDAGRSRVNVYWPIEVPRQVGDVTPFLTHLQKLLPDPRDRQILLAYMCACVQHKGVKFQWAPLLQGVEGNGKTLLTRCVAHAVGKRYVHWPKASKLAKEFNAWMLNKLFYAVEDIYVPGNRREVIEELKPMITGDELEIEGKGVDQISADVCGNFMFNSNHKDALAKTRNDRRFAVFYTAQQQMSDLARDGMTGGYMSGIYEWLKDGGYAIVSELLHTLPIPDEFNPAGACDRAPSTTSTEEAIGESLGSIEQEILEAITQGAPGFAGGWVSSTKLNELLEEQNATRRVPLNKRRALMQSLGYIYHPALIDGRLNNIVLPDGNKPRLFIRADHADRFLTASVDIAKAYSSAQGVSVSNVS